MDSLWTLGLALGLAVDAGLALALALSGRGLDVRNLPQYATVAVSVAVICWQGLPVLVSAFRAAVGTYVAWDAWQHRYDAPESEPVMQPVPVDPDDRGWYLAIEITLLAGQVTGFTDEGLSSVMGSDARPRMQRFLFERGILTLRNGSAGYGWADNVTLADALRRLRAGSLSPYPTDPAPEVRPPVVPATRRAPPRRAATVVEGTAKAAD